MPSKRSTKKGTTKTRRLRRLAAWQKDWPLAVVGNTAATAAATVAELPALVLPGPVDPSEPWAELCLEHLWHHRHCPPFSPFPGPLPGESPFLAPRILAFGGFPRRSRLGITSWGSGTAPPEHGFSSPFLFLSLLRGIGLVLLLGRTQCIFDGRFSSIGIFPQFGN